MTLELRKEIYRRDGWSCVCCGNSNNIQIHHIVKRSLGGKDYTSNLVTLCGHCHVALHGTPLFDYPLDSADVEFSIVQYMSDYYAEQGYQWNANELRLTPLYWATENKVL